MVQFCRAAKNPIDAPIRLDGEWEARTEGQFFLCFDPDRHVSDRIPKGILRVCLGVDYAAADRELGMCAVLSYVWEVTESDGRSHHHVLALDEVVVPGSTTMEVFAGKILRMLEDRGIGWHELDQVYGDNPVRTRFAIASNIELGKWIARNLRVRQEHLRPKLLNAKEGDGASGDRRRTKDVRCRWLFGQIAADRVRVHPRCKTLLQGLAEWDYDDKHPLKDVLDSWMYGLRDQWADWGRHEGGRILQRKF